MHMGWADLDKRLHQRDKLGRGPCNRIMAEPLARRQLYGGRAQPTFNNKVKALGENTQHFFCFGGSTFA